MAAHRKRPSAAPIRGWLVRLGATALNMVLIVAVIGFAALAIGPRFGGYRTLTILSGSMHPGISTGSVLIDVPRKPTAVHVGDVITIQAPTADHHVYSHRVISVTDVDGVVSVRTKGDANASPDPWTAQLQGSKVWIVKATIPYVGMWIQKLRSPHLHLVAAVVMPALLVLAGLYAVWFGSPRARTA